MDVFSDVFKQLKRKNPPPDLSQVINFESCNDNLTHCSDLIYKLDLNAIAQEENSDTVDCSTCLQHGLRCHCTWELYSCKKTPGFIFIRNPFSPLGQTLWIKKCLDEYPQVTNLGENFVNGVNCEVTKLRWATLGYHHDWNSKVYSKERQSPFPLCLKSLSQHVLSVLGMKLDPQAAIVNYYHLSSTLGGHTDHSELDLTLPLVSFSFGRTAIFMLGGRSKSISPVPMFVRSGDVVIMSGECRHAYHAVPRILPPKHGEDIPWQMENESLEEYLREFRININVRQVSSEW